MKLSKVTLVAAILPLLASCVDSNYDLSDIDTTVEMQVKNLVVPINIDAVTLGSIVNLKEDEVVKVYNGEYAIICNGSFNSDDVSIPSIHLTAPTLNPSENVVELSGLQPMSRAAAQTFSFDLGTTESDFTFTSSFVSPFIVRIDKIGCDIKFSLRFTLKEIENYVNRLTLRNAVLQMPKGLTLSDAAGGTYNPATGELSLPDRTITTGSLDISLTATGLDFAQAGGVYDYDNSQIRLTGSLYLKQGVAEISADDIKTGVASLPSSLIFRTDYSISDIEVTTFSGHFKYTLNHTALTNVDLSSLPDVFSQSSTNLAFVNPMLYLQVTNPLQSYDIYARTGMEILAYHGTQSKSYALNDSYFQIGPDNADGIYNFCLSPKSPADPDPEFPGSEHIGFSQLSNVLEGNGIPQKLEISLTDPRLPDQTVTDFKLGQSLGALHGKYKLVVPLEFTPGSSITYTKTIDGWGSEDLDALTVTTLEVSLRVTTDIPVDIEFTGYPVDASGNQIDGVELVGATIPANASNHSVLIRATGEFTDLDGICFTAVARAADDGTLAPDMTIDIKEIRPCVSGYYTKKL
ncbi:MAG: hypothetical protein K2H74_02715 [Paramuribaculum sp.]|nr:hypothetical protein [Paramuribaculum sp.]